MVEVVEGVEWEQVASIATTETVGVERADITLECEEGMLVVVEREGILWKREGIISSVLALLLLTPFFFGSACPCFFLLYSAISLSA